jgi:nicotinate-nucleotide adenylyltransferase
MKIGILGGTFDPVHNGHIYLAEKACAKLRLDKIIFIPSYLPPHKKGTKVTPARDRFNMLKLAIRGNKKFKISDMEIKRKGRSYSVETLRRLRKKYGAKAELFFITGSDSLKELNKWKNLPEILRLCRFVVVKRPCFKANNAPGGVIMLKISAKNISATDIRARIRTDKPINRLTPGFVQNYICRHKLYGILIALFLIFGANIAYSSQDTSASTITRSQEMIEKEKFLREKIDKDDKVYLKKAIATGVTLIDKEKIKEIIEPFKNHWISKNDIQIILDSITAAYKEKGYADKLGSVSYKIRKNTLNIIIMEISQ